MLDHAFSKGKDIKTSARALSTTAAIAATGCDGSRRAPRSSRRRKAASSRAANPCHCAGRTSSTVSPISTPQQQMKAASKRPLGRAYSPEEPGRCDCGQAYSAVHAHWPGDLAYGPHTEGHGSGYEGDGGAKGCIATQEQAYAFFSPHAASAQVPWRSIRGSRPPVHLIPPPSICMQPTSPTPACVCGKPVAQKLKSTWEPSPIHLKSPARADSNERDGCSCSPPTYS